MMPRERVLAALSHVQPDRCPVDFWAVPEVVNRLLAYFNARDEEELYDLLEIDVQFVFPRSTKAVPDILPDGSYFDEMGVHRRLVKNGYCSYEEYASSPLGFVKEIKDFERYTNWPDASAFDWEHFSQDIGDRHEKRYIKLHAGGLFEYAWALRGYEQYMMDMALSPEIPHYIMGKLCDYWCDFIQNAMAAAGDKIDLVYTYDDIAAQSALLMSPDMLEEFIYPYHRRLNALIKSYGKKIMFHSCGAVVPEIRKLAELPIDVLNPLQPKAKDMDFEMLKRFWGDRLCFHGGICLQETLPKGTPEQVRDEVKRAISILGKDGGYIMTSAHYIQNDTPIENILALYDVKIR